MKSKGTAPEILCVGWIAFALCDSACMAQGQGTVCLVPGGFDDFSKGGATVEAYEEHLHHPETGISSESVRFVQVDGLAPVKVTSLKAGKITGIGIAGKHSMKISKRSDMTQTQATFRFSFSEQKSDRLCLWYETFYGSWRLRKALPVIAPRSGERERRALSLEKEPEP